MKYYISLFFLLFAMSMSAQRTVKMTAVKANNYGVAYSLPKTAISVEIQYTKTVRKAGEFYRYAERYLSLSNPITEDDVVYKIVGVKATNIGVPDKENSYLIPFKSGTTAPYVTLFEDGIICAINDEPTSEVMIDEKKQIQLVEDLPDPKTFLSEEILRAGSSVKQAELIAKQIYLLRETRTGILTGEADNIPPDGEAYKIVMKQLETQEKALTAMFMGTETESSVMSEIFQIVPERESIDKQVVTRFSTKLGIVAADDLSGAPIYLNLKSIEPIEEVVLTEKEAKAWEDKYSKGVVFNIPAKANLTISYKGKEYVNTEFDVVQFGSKEVLTNRMFENNKKPIKIIFYPNLGAIKQIIE